MINLLDGLRDLKAPLASGLIILFGFWLIYANEVSTAGPGQSIAGNIHQLIDFLGGPATLGLVAFLAYVIGLVLSLHHPTRRLIRILAKIPRGELRGVMLWDELLGLFSFKAPTHYRFREYSTATQSRLDDYIERILVDAVEKNGWTHKDIVQNISPNVVKNYSFDTNADRIGPTGDRISNFAYFSPITRKLSAEITADIDLLAVQLHAEKDKIYEKYDKNKTESDFRAAVILPILFVAGTLTWRLFSEAQPVMAVPAMLGAMLVAVRLAFSAQERLLEANEAILHSLAVGHIKSPRMLIFEHNRSPGKDGGTGVTV